MVNDICYVPWQSNVQRPTSSRAASLYGPAIVLKILIFLLFLASLTLSVGLGEGYGGDFMQKKGPLLPPCPTTPNCVSSLPDQANRRIEPFFIRGSLSDSLDRLTEIIKAMPRTTIIGSTERKLQAEFRTRLGFVDDVLFVADEGQGVIHVRSSSRSGTWDWGVNRRRVERIRKRYQE